MGVALPDEAKKYHSSHNEIALVGEWSGPQCPFPDRLSLNIPYHPYRHPAHGYAGFFEDVAIRPQPQYRSLVIDTEAFFHCLAFAESLLSAAVDGVFARRPILGQQHKRQQPTGRGLARARTAVVRLRFPFSFSSPDRRPNRRRGRCAALRP